MTKITVRDTFKEFHTFTGDVYSVEQDGGCKVFQRLPDGKSKMLQSFGPHVFGWVRVEEDKTLPVYYGDGEPRHDRFTQDALQSASTDRPTLHNGDYDLNQDQIPDFLPEKNLDDESEFGRMADDRPALVSALKKEPVPVSEQANVPGGVMSLEAGTVPGQKPPSRQRTRPSKKSAAQATLDAALEEGLIPPKMDKGNPDIVIEPKGEEGPPPKLDDLLAAGVIQKGADNLKSPPVDIAADLADAVIDDPEIREVDIDAELSAAEKRHAERQLCETCHGRGTVPDPDSDDPLDTTICPDC